ncbi:hypothetical protein KFL_005040060 [Klebsormidium nitens]|uniref:C2H2-type domain-containing protein n=1 Tax=Klebsormidium nitens TaxID=105231 RepID=A0A1Y1IGS4_KLENI|nr:hypothetical protein KFL_005040060 [Klebsormidium nitens]|eukprot:GAQ89262.1 hypothetical protein KFL_005040060 [Klebsormidium nitens]
MPHKCAACGREFPTPASLGSHRESFACPGQWVRHEAGPSTKAAPAEELLRDLSIAEEAGPSQALAEPHGSKRQRVELPEEREGQGAASVEDHGAHQAHSAGGSFFSDPVEDPEKSRFPQLDDEIRETLKILQFVRRCRNNVGLSEQDTRSLMNLLFFQDLDASKVKARTPAALKKFEERVLFKESDGWVSIDLSKEGDPYPIILRMRDPEEALKEMLSNSANSTGLADRPQDSKGNRTVSSPDTATFWEQAQEYINRTGHAGAVIAPLIMNSDVTTLSNDMSVLGWPFALTSANIASHRRNEPGGHALVAIFPILHAVPGHPGFEPGSAELTLRKLEVFQECLRLVLQPLKDASFTGFMSEDPDAEERWFYPMLFAYVCDHPEGCKVTCTKDTNQTNAPCSICMCPASRLCEVDKHFHFRTQKGMMAAHAKITNKDIDPVKRDQWSMGLSLHPVECALWGFNGGDTDWGNPYRAVHVDMMHQTDLGLFPTICDALLNVAAGSHRTAIARAIEKALMDIKENYRFADLRVPGSDKGGYFTSSGRSKFAAFEHRAVMQVVIPALVGLVDNSIIAALVEFVDWVILACRTDEHTEASLTQMERQGEKAVKAIIRTLGEGQASEFRIIKIHLVSHYRDCIWRSGVPIHYSTNLFESLDIQLLKIGYRASNRRNAMDQVLKHHRRLCQLRKAAGLPNADEEDQEDEEQRTEDNARTALQRAMTSDPRRNVLSSVKLNLRLPWLEHISNPSSDPADGPSSSKHARELLNQQPELRHLATQLRKFLGKDYDRIAKRVVTVHSALALPTGDSDRFGPRPMCARAVPSFHGRPWYSNIALQGEAEGQAPWDLHAQVRLFLSCTVEGHAPGQQRRHEMALVRYYKKLPAIDKLTNTRLDIEIVVIFQPGQPPATSHQPQMYRVLRTCTACCLLQQVLTSPKKHVRASVGTGCPRLHRSGVSFLRLTSSCTASSTTPTFAYALLGRRWGGPGVVDSQRSISLLRLLCDQLDCVTCSSSAGTTFRSGGILAETLNRLGQRGRRVALAHLLASTGQLEGHARRRQVCNVSLLLPARPPARVLRPSNHRLRAVSACGGLDDCKSMSKTFFFQFGIKLHESTSILFARLLYDQRCCGTSFCSRGMVETSTLTAGVEPGLWSGGCARAGTGAEARATLTDFAAFCLIGSWGRVARGYLLVSTRPTLGTPQAHSFGTAKLWSPATTSTTCRPPLKLGHQPSMEIKPAGQQ